MARQPITGRSVLSGEIRPLVRDIAQFGGRRLVGAILLMLAGSLFEGIGLAMLIRVFALLPRRSAGGGTRGSMRC